MIQEILNRADIFEATRRLEWSDVNGSVKLRDMTADTHGDRLSVLMRKTELVEEFEHDGHIVHRYEQVKSNGKKTLYIKFIDEKKVEVMMYVDFHKASWTQILEDYGIYHNDDMFDPHAYNFTSIDDVLEAHNEYKEDNLIDIDTVQSWYYVLEDTTPEEFENAETKLDMEFVPQPDGTVKCMNNSVIGGMPWQEYAAQGVAVDFHFFMAPVQSNAAIASGAIKVLSDHVKARFNKPVVTFTNDPRKNADVHCDNASVWVMKTMMIYRVIGTHIIQAENKIEMKTMPWEPVDLWGDIELDPQALIEKMRNLK